MTPRIFAIRIRKLKYRRKILGIFGSRVLVDEASNECAELVGTKKQQAENAEFEVEDNEDTDDETEDYERVDEKDVSWIMPKSLT